MNDSLLGKRILITRPAHQAEETARRIAVRGGEAILFPCLEISCLPQNIVAASGQLDGITDILFTSANGVHCTARALGEALPTLLAGKRIAAVGSKTADALGEYHIPVDLMPATYSQEGLADLYRTEGLPRSLLFFRAEEGRDLLTRFLEEAGCDVTLITAYETICPTGDASEATTLINSGNIDAVLLGSPKTALNYLQRIGDIATANAPVIVAISPQVAETATTAGLGVQVVAKTASFDAMLDALASYYS